MTENPSNPIALSAFNYQDDKRMGPKRTDFNPNDIDEAVRGTMKCLLEDTGAAALKLCLDNGIELYFNPKEKNIRLVCGDYILMQCSLEELIVIKFPKKCETNYQKVWCYYDLMIKAIEKLP